MHQGISKFVETQYSLLEDSSLSKILSWRRNGTSFVIIDPHQFAEDILPQYFNHNNYPSYLRQLNIYGFKKSKSENGIYEFSHKYFKKGMKSLLPMVKKSSSPQISDDQYEHDSLAEWLQNLINAQKELQNTFREQVYKYLNLQSHIIWLKGMLTERRQVSKSRGQKLQNVLFQLADGLTYTEAIKDYIKSLISEYLQEEPPMIKQSSPLMIEQSPHSDTMTYYTPIQLL